MVNFIQDIVNTKQELRNLDELNRTQRTHWVFFSMMGLLWNNLSWKVFILLNPFAFFNPTPSLDRNVQYSIGNIVNNIVITMYDAWWVLEILGRGDSL